MFINVLFMVNFLSVCYNLSVLHTISTPYARIIFLLFICRLCLFNVAFKNYIAMSSFVSWFTHSINRMNRSMNSDVAINLSPSDAR